MEVSSVLRRPAESVGGVPRVHQEASCRLLGKRVWGTGETWRLVVYPEVAAALCVDSISQGKKGKEKRFLRNQWISLVPDITE